VEILLEPVILLGERWISCNSYL